MKKQRCLRIGPIRVTWWKYPFWRLHWTHFSLGRLEIVWRTGLKEKADA